MICPKSTMTELFVNPWTLLGWHQTVFNLTVLIAHRVVPIQAIALPLLDIAIMCVHDLSINI